MVNDLFEEMVQFVDAMLSKEPVAAVQVVVSPSDESRLEAARARWKQDFAARSGTVAAVLARFPVDDVPTPRVEGDD